MLRALLMAIQLLAHHSALSGENCLAASSVIPDSTAQGAILAERLLLLLASKRKLLPCFR